MRIITTPSTTAHSIPVRVEVPTGISRQAKTSAAANSVTRRSGGKIVPKRASQMTSGMIAMAAVEMVLPS